MSCRVPHTANRRPNAAALFSLQLALLSAALFKACCRLSLRNRQFAILNLRYHDGTQIRVMVMKNLKGTAAADNTLQLDLRKRRAILETVFEFLCLPFTGATMVVGDLGVGLATSHNHMR